MLSAGESSGDRLGAGLAEALRLRRPEIELYGMGGERMQRAGVRLIQDAHEIAVVGIFEVLSHLPRLRATMRRLEQSLNGDRPDLLIPIDFPDFNLRLAKRSARARVPVVYFVSPQIWAWRRRRIHLIRRLVRRMLVLFPFEVQLYEEAGVPVSFVGHPLAEPRPAARPKVELAAHVGLDPRRPIVALMPGSRRGEASHLLPMLLQAAKILKSERPALQFLVPEAPGLEPGWGDERIGASGVRDARAHRGDFPEILSICDAGACAAGTASLEAAITGLPMIVVYHMNSLSYAIGRLLVRLQDVALPNLVAGRRVIPELIQGDCRPEAIAAALGRFLDDPSQARRMRAAQDEVRRRLGGPGIFERAADAVLEELDAVL
jgi:lipid-A-disaccharide synthase